MIDDTPTYICFFFFKVIFLCVHAGMSTGMTFEPPIGNIVTPFLIMSMRSVRKKIWGNFEYHQKAT